MNINRKLVLRLGKVTNGEISDWLKYQTLEKSCIHNSESSSLRKLINPNLFKRKARKSNGQNSETTSNRRAKKAKTQKTLEKRELYL